MEGRNNNEEEPAHAGEEEDDNGLVIVQRGGEEGQNDEEEDANSQEQEDERGQNEAADDDGQDGDDEASDASAEAFDSLAVLGPNDRGRMQLLEHEIEWALSLKQVMKEHPDLASLSDYEIVQIIHVHDDNIEEGILKAHMLQDIRSEYDIEDSVESAQLFLQEACRRFPGFFLSFSFTMEREGGHYTLALDTAKFSTRRLSNPADFKIWATSIYFCLQAMNCDFEAMRQGLLFLVECGGFDWKEHLNLSTFKRTQTEFNKVPTKWHQLRHFNTGLFFNLLVSMGKAFIADEQKGRLQVGCVSPAGRLDNIFLQPTVEAANQRFVQRVTEALQRRYTNAASFVLK